MSRTESCLLAFEEVYFDRIWGGQKLRTSFGKAAPPDRPIGEAWLISDHGECESVVRGGAHDGETLRHLLERDAEGILGSRAELTVHGRFPLLLKLLDARDVLSVQVHPDDECAARLNEPDVGKTEMWHVLEAEPGAELICGLDPAFSREAFVEAVGDGSIEDVMWRFPAPVGASAFVPAGTVHAIGAGLVIAEIQQNSNLTYRLYDWNRVDGQGRGRELHVERALESIHFGSAFGGAACPLEYKSEGGACHVLAACRYFAAELVAVAERYSRAVNRATFHILLGKEGEMAVRSGDDEAALRRGEALLVAGGTDAFEVAGRGAFLDYYVPDLEADVAAPLRKAGHGEEAIARLGA